MCIKRLLLLKSSGVLIKEEINKKWNRFRDGRIIEEKRTMIK